MYTNKQAVILADMLATALIKISIYKNRDGFNADFIAELSEFNAPEDYPEVYAAILKLLEQ